MNKKVSLFTMICFFVLSFIPFCSEANAAFFDDYDESESQEVFLFSNANAGQKYTGIDVSHHQGKIDWDKVANQIDFVIIRCGYGKDRTSQDDSYWSYNLSACQRLGIPFGVYLYSYATTNEDALSEANHVLRLINGVKLDLPVYLDLEDGDTVGKCSNAAILEHTKIFCNAISNNGLTPGVYANKSWWTTRLTDAAYDNWSRWLAQTEVSQPSYNKHYDIWQYTFDGTVSGISGKVDMNYWYGSLPNQNDPWAKANVKISVSTTKATSSSLPASGNNFDKGTTVFFNGSISGITVDSGVLYVTPPGGSETQIDTVGKCSTYFWLGSGSDGYKANFGGTYNYRIRLVSGGHSKDFTGTFDVKQDKVYLDLNGYLDGQDSGGISNYGTVDVYINGNCVATGVTDYYEQVAIGSTYEFKNIKANSGYTYHGVWQGSTSGTIGTQAVNVRLNFRKNVDVGTGFYARIANTNSGKYLTNDDNENVSSRSLNESTYASSAAQLWYFMRQSDGTYKIRSDKDKKFLDVLFGKDVHVHSDGDYDSMRWAIHQVGDKYIFGVKSTEYVMDLADNSSAEGANIQMWQDNGTGAQTFSIIKYGYLDVNWILDGKEERSTQSYGTVDVYVGGNKVASGCNDYVKAYKTGTSYKIDNIQPRQGYKFDKVQSGSLTGNVGSAATEIWISFSTVHVDSVGLNKTSLTLSKGSSETLSATVNPSNALNKGLTWSSSNTGVATVDGSGKVTAVNTGTATITVKTSDGGKTASCTVTVSLPTYVFDLNGLLDGVSRGVITDYGTADVSIGGKTYNDVADVYDTFPEGTSYEISDIKAANGHVYLGMTEGNGTTETFAGKLTGKIGTSNVSVRLAFASKADLGADFYARIKNTGLNRYVTNDGHTDTSRSNVASRSATGGLNQIWHFVRLSNGAYKIISVTDGCALDVQDALSTTGANIQTYPDAAESKPAQQWYIAGEAGAYRLRPLCSQCVLDVSGDSADEGTNIQTWYSCGGRAQKFTIEKLDSGTVDLDVNYILDGEEEWNSQEYGTFDVIVNGTKVADDCKDYVHSWPLGTSYEITDIKSTNGHKYEGVKSGNLTGQVGPARTEIWLKFSTVKVDGVSLNKTSLSLAKGSSETLSVTISPANAANKGVTWTSSNTGVATVDNNGKVTAVNAGSATITVKTSDGGKTASCTVTVSLPTYVFDLNGLLDGESKGSISAYGTVDASIGGKSFDDVYDIYETFQSGTSYEVSDIKATDGHVYLGMAEGNGTVETHQGKLTGEIGANGVGVRLAFASYSDLGEDFYARIKNTGLDRYVSNSGATETSRSNVTSRSASGGLDQIWHFVRLSNGAYKIISTLDGCALDVQDSKSTAGANIQTYPDAAETKTAQQWYIAGEAGAYRLRPLCSQCVLDVSGDSADESTNIQTWYSCGGRAQKFTIEKLDSGTVDLDVNYILDGEEEWYSQEYGTFDVIVDGTKVADDCKDYVASWPLGTSYEITDIKSTNGHRYDGVKSGKLSGQVGPARTEIWLIFSSDSLPISDAKFVIENQTVSPGAEFDVPVIVKNNPGIAGFDIQVTYDPEQLELIGSEAKDFPGVTFSYALNEIPYRINWDSTEDNKGSVAALLRFKAKSGDKDSSIIRVSFAGDELPYNSGMENVPFSTENGVITIRASIPGDANGDGAVTMKDSTIIRQYLAGWPVTINQDEADANGDEVVTMKDSTIIRQYLAGWPVSLRNASASLFSASEEENNINAQMLSEITPQVKIENKEVETGEIIEIPILFENNPGIAGFDFEVEYDTKYLSLKGSKDGDFDGVTFSKSLETNPYVFLWDSTTENTGKIAAILLFEVNEKAIGSTEIKVSIHNNTLPYTSRFEDIEFNLVNGTIQIAKTVRETAVTGNVSKEGAITFEVKDAPNEALLIAASYNENKMKDIYIKSIPSGDSKDLIGDLKGGNEYKIFIVYSSNYIPICQAWDIKVLND